ncbi:hypothetical protein K492DRAFT_207709 [Lichtheimia hyalospora FSU 10163]|nr:hypothetical protein K492DRAFT_207709 [Lichtheimia hyalospora FSU 10163]
MNEYMYITTTTSSNNDKIDSSLFRLPSPPPNNNNANNFTSPFQQQLFSTSDDPTSCILPDTWTSSSSSSLQAQPSTTTTTTTTDPTNNDPTACDLRDILMYYRSQPDLLRLILLSKVEEDKRRTEEARLRAKELDIMLLQQQQELMIGMLPGTMATADDQQLEESPRKRARELSDTLFPISPTDEQQPTMDNSNDEPPSFTSTLDMPSNTNTSSSPSSSTPTSLFHLASSYAPSQPNNHDSVSEQDSITTGSVRRPPRRRREMQAITKIVETREYPYMDGFFWKNNGNTVQKKTGNKSIYYKCSNSSKGCPVNKTVTWKENGEFLIKYRGEHLPECGKVERIIDV